MQFWDEEQNILSDSRNLAEMFLPNSVLRSVDLWVTKCVKSRTFLFRHRARFPSPSGPASRTSLPTNTYTSVHVTLLHSPYLLVFIA